MRIARIAFVLALFLGQSAGTVHQSLHPAASPACDTCAIAHDLICIAHELPVLLAPAPVSRTSELPAPPVLRLRDFDATAARAPPRGASHRVA